ncbi:MAG: thermostable hemolysin [Pseudomonadota bacterium]
MTHPMTISAYCPPDSPEVLPVFRCAGRWFSEIRAGTDTAARTTDFIRRRFLQAYGAEPVLRVPGLLALTTAQGSLLAAVGVRNAGQERLFLEDYLSTPVQAAMPELGQGRGAIAEIAHLAGVEAGVSRYLFASLSLWLRNAGFRWVVCTGTDQLRNSFHRLGIPTHVIAHADPTCLADGGTGWGRYYEHQPVVMAIRVADGIAALEHGGLLRLVKPVTPAGVDQANGGAVYGHLA